MRTQLSETSTSGFVLNSKGDQNQLATLDFVTISDYFVKDLAKCLHVFSFLILCPHHYYYCKIETKCDPTKLIQYEHLLQARHLVYTGDCSQNLERIPKLN